MPKRFRDTEIWDKVWFRKSKPKYKCFISYLFDKCDHAGIWEVDKDRMEFYIYDKFKESLDDLLNMYSEHIIRISNTKWFLIDFIPFQYKCKIENLNPKNTVHKSVIDILAKYDVLNILNKIDRKKSKGLSSPLKGAKDKDKDKDQSKDMDMDMDKDKDRKKQYLKYVFITREEHQKLTDKLGEEKTKEMIGALNNYIGSKGKQYKSHYHTILTWVRMEKNKKRSKLL